MNWKSILLQLEEFESLEGLDPFVIDTLHGSMWGRGHRFMSLEEAMEIDASDILAYSMRRLRCLIQDEDITSTMVQEVVRTGVGVGTYGWKYDHQLMAVSVVEGAALIDTAEGYGYGKVENEFGDALKGFPDMPIATKVRRDHMSPKAIKRAALRSKKKLGRAPHYQIHFPNDKYPNAVLDLVEMRRRGTILSIGLGNCSVDQVEAAQRMLSDYSGDVIRSVQVSFSLLNQRVKHTMIPYCQPRGILVIAYSPLGQDFKLLDRPVLHRMAKKYDATPAQVALAWVLSHSGVMPIPRTNNVDHLKLNIEAAQLELDPADVAELETEYDIQQERIH